MPSATGYDGRPADGMRVVTRSLLELEDVIGAHRRRARRLHQEIALVEIERDRGLDGVEEDVRRLGGLEPVGGLRLLPLLHALRARRHGAEDGGLVESLPAGADDVERAGAPAEELHRPLCELE